MKIPQDPRIPTPAGHYSPVVEHHGLDKAIDALDLDRPGEVYSDGKGLATHI